MILLLVFFSQSLYAQYLHLPWQIGDVWKVEQGYHEHTPGSPEDD
jgi:hypothetical protein